MKLKFNGILVLIVADLCKPTSACERLYSMIMQECLPGVSVLVKGTKFEQTLILTGNKIKATLVKF
jgi:formate-dependent nitrite reductase membrane component NrfD